MKFLKGCAVLIGAFFGLIIIVGIFAPKNTKQPTSVSPSGENSFNSAKVEPKPSSGVTMANYLKLKQGMSYEEVAKVLGKEGEEMSSNQIANIKSSMYKWDGENFASGVTAMFQNGKMISRSQVNLK